VAPASFKEYGRLGAPIMMSRLPLNRLRERLTSYEEGLAEGPHDDATRAGLRRQAAVWRHVYVGESQQEAEDTLRAAVRHTREHMLHARSAYNPEDFQVDSALLNPYSDPRVSDEDGVRWSLETGALCGTTARVAEQIAELRDTGVHHLFCQLSFGYLPHEKIMASMRRFGELVLPRFPEG
jgi:alkanesulfonate monooxygenase SsuD/methylene tetrahydromethanopterin reductase-like flavin-dependent oxidoreductase (luciferase family)